MAYNVLRGTIEFSDTTTGSIESMVDNWSAQVITGVKTFSSTLSASAFWDTVNETFVTAPAIKTITGDGAGRVIVSDGDGTATCDSSLIYTVGQGLTASYYSGSGVGLTSLPPDQFSSALPAASVNYGYGLTASSGQLIVKGGDGITVDASGVAVTITSNGGAGTSGGGVIISPANATDITSGGQNLADFDIMLVEDVTHGLRKTTLTNLYSNYIAGKLPAPAITSYTNSTDNRILTSVNSTTVNGEANLTFDGSILVVAAAVSGSGTLYNAGPATFSSTITATGSVTAEGFSSTELISGSLGMHIDQPASFGGSIFATGSLSSSAALSVVGSSHFSAPINVSTSVGNVGVVVENTSVDAYGATIALYNSRGGGAGSDNDFAGGVIYRAQNAASELVHYGKISGKVATNTDGAEDGLIVFEVCDNGTPQTAYLTMDGANSALTASVDIHLQAATHQSGSVYKLYGTRTGDYTLSANDHIIYMNTNSARLTASLPDARTVGGIVYTVKNIGSNDMIIHPYSTQTVDGLSALTGTLGKAWTIQAMDDIWLILSSHQG